MDNDSKFWLAVIGLAALTICTLIVTVGVTTYNTNKRAFENGYEAVQLGGTTTCAWQKAK